MNYWEECISEALDNAGVAASPEQINVIAKSIAMAHEMYAEAHGYDMIQHPAVAEAKSLRQQLETERELVFCQECKSKGQITSYGPFHLCVTQCWKCRGEGKHKR